MAGLGGEEGLVGVRRVEGGDRGLTGIGVFIVVLGRDIEGYGDAIGCFGDVWLLVSGDGVLQRS